MLCIISAEDTLLVENVSVIAENFETFLCCVETQEAPRVHYEPVNDIPQDMVQVCLPRKYGTHLTYEEYRRGKIFENNEWMSLEEVAEIDRILTGEVSINDET